MIRVSRLTKRHERLEEHHDSSDPLIDKVDPSKILASGAGAEGGSNPYAITDQIGSAPSTPTSRCSRPPWK